MFCRQEGQWKGEEGEQSSLHRHRARCEGHDVSAAARRQQKREKEAYRWSADQPLSLSTALT